MSGKGLLVVLAILVVGALRIRSRRRRSHPPTSRTRRGGMDVSSPIALVTQREIRERLRSRTFLVTTVIILVVVGAAIIIPSHGSTTAQPVRVGTIGPASVTLRAAANQAATALGTEVAFREQPSEAAATTALSNGRIDVVVKASSLLVNDPLAATDTSVTAEFVRALATQLGIARAMAEAKLTAAQIEALYAFQPYTITASHPAKASTPIDVTSIFGIIVIFIMLQQYSQWTLLGVMEEKSSRVIEVLLSSVRPLQLIAGKVLGIGIVAVAQAASVVALALVVGAMADSPILHGMQPWVIATSVLWLFLGYAFYSWLFAAAGSMIERQDQAQSVALPLSIPLIFGYVFGLIQASSPSISLFAKLLAYVPPTAPFLVPTLVGRHAVSWWQVAISVGIDVVATIALARGAARIYARAILHTGSRMRWSEVVHWPRPRTPKGV